MRTSLNLNEVPAATSTNDEINSNVMMSHDETLTAFFSGYPFHLSTDYINDFLLSRFNTIEDVFDHSTLRIWPSSLIIQLNRLNRLDDYESLEEELTVFSGFVTYLKAISEDDVDLWNFDAEDFDHFLYDHFLDIQETLVESVTRLRDIHSQHTRVSTAKFRARGGTAASKPKVGFAAPVPGGSNSSDTSSSGTSKASSFRGHNVDATHHEKKPFPGKPFPGAYTPAPAPASAPMPGPSSAPPPYMAAMAGTYSGYPSGHTPGPPYGHGYGHHYPHSPGAFSAAGTAYSTAQSKIVKRGVFEHKPPKWNGTYDTFPAAEAQLRSYALGSKMPYIITLAFLNTYKQHKSLKKIHEEFRNHDGLSLYEFGITYQQLQHDAEAMFGAIVSIGQGKYATAVTNKYDKNSDGIGAYIDLCDKFRLPHSVRSQQATVIINNPTGGYNNSCLIWKKHMPNWIR